VTARPLTDRELARLDQLIEEQERVFMSRQPKSAELTDRARRSLAGGVTSSWQIARPQPVWVSHGRGSRIVDVDGNEYVDLHGGYGVMAVGHAHPEIVRAVSDRIRLGSHFAQPTEDAVAVAENLASRWGLPLWRFCNSGTEATMDAVHLMRAVTGRSKIVKVEGTYHGHHDSVQVSVHQLLPELGPLDRPWSVPASSGIPEEMTRLTLVAPFNDPEALEGIFEEEGADIAGMIMEPIMMNAGIIRPEPGFLETVRAVTRRHGALLAFDEVKTGFTVSPGGATELYGVVPDLVCLAKAVGGGIACAALGGTAEVMGYIATGHYEQVGTFNGNPMAMAAARVAVSRILTEDAYEHFTRLRKVMVEGCELAIAEHDLPAHVVAIGAKGCIVFSETPVRNYRQFLLLDDRLSHLHWLIQHNNGVFLPPWGKAEQWLVSVQHSEEDVRRFTDNFTAFVRALRG
jgi:glutamate-1-semialdehyde 2,1-aminomutase